MQYELGDWLSPRQELSTTTCMAVHAATTSPPTLSVPGNGYQVYAQRKTYALKDDITLNSLLFLFTCIRKHTAAPNTTHPSDQHLLKESQRRWRWDCNPGMNECLLVPKGYYLLKESHYLQISVRKIQALHTHKAHQYKHHQKTFSCSN